MLEKKTKKMQYCPTSSGSTKVSLRLFYQGSTLVSQMAVVSEKVFFGVFRRSADCSLHLSPSLVLGSKLQELLACLTHTPPIRRKRMMSLLLGNSLGLFILGSFFLI